ncbi:hypothetical protein GGC64_003642 [Mycobacterium sp. OAS707]|uniref:Dabb family protein n=1 Tax=Mycobacterium sp. OAS707 TaxID=2663822 RepID=UPI00178B683A|nr:Dabb family protein [Mycobacterium sp. OAS707]MBE1549618.1 hypothetical protein [Mycobacterium sp. OAS707]
MPVGHVVTFTFRAGTPPASVAALGAALDELASETTTLSYHHGPDMKLRPGNADYSVTAIFEDEAAFSEYIMSPKHLRIVSELLQPHLQARSAVQFFIG